MKDEEDRRRKSDRRARRERRCPLPSGKWWLTPLGRIRPDNKSRLVPGFLAKQSFMLSKVIAELRGVDESRDCAAPRGWIQSERARLKGRTTCNAFITLAPGSGKKSQVAHSGPDLADEELRRIPLSDSAILLISRAINHEFVRVSTFSSSFSAKNSRINSRLCLSRNSNTSKTVSNFGLKLLEFLFQSFSRIKKN